MRPRRDIRERVTRGGRWLPPKADGNNERYSSTRFYHDSQTTAVVDSIPATALPDKTFSIYYERAVIWNVDYDATSQKVHDGRETSAAEGAAAEGELDVEVSDDEELRDDWAPITFSHLQDYISYIGRRLDQLRLCIQRPNQIWAQHILPDPYTAQEVRQSYGGLIGELPLLIGLMALAIPEEHVQGHIPRATGNPWQVPNFARSAGWQDKRGLVVRTYADPPQSSLEDLREYENGVHGIILT